MNFLYNHDFENFLLHQLKSDGKLSGPKDSALLAEITTDPRGNFLNKHIEVIQKNWDQLEPKFLENICRFFNIKHSNTENLEVRLIRLSIFPYQYSNTKEPWFAAPLFTYPSDRNRVIMHELIHYFQPKQTSRAFKEAIPVILNSGDFGICNTDKGHNEIEEQSLRTKIIKMYSAGKTFDEIYKAIS